jgi:hypothetical protein
MQFCGIRLSSLYTGSEEVSNMTRKEFRIDVLKNELVKIEEKRRQTQRKLETQEERLKREARRTRNKDIKACNARRTELRQLDAEIDRIRREIAVLEKSEAERPKATVRVRGALNIGDWAVYRQGGGVRIEGRITELDETAGTLAIREKSTGGIMKVSMAKGSLEKTAPPNQTRPEEPREHRKNGGLSR